MIFLYESCVDEARELSGVHAEHQGYTLLCGTAVELLYDHGECANTAPPQEGKQDIGA